MSLPRTAISRSFATFSARSSCRLDTPGFRQASCILQTHNHAEVNPIVRSTKHQYRTYVRFTRAASTTVDRSQESDASDSGSKRTAIAQRLPAESKHSPQRLREFGLDNRVFIVTGGARGLGLTLAEALVEAGGHVYCLDRLPKPDETFHDTKHKLAQEFEGSLHYRQVDVQNVDNLNNVIAEIAAKHKRMDGLIAAAGVQMVVPALEYPPDKISEMLAINYTGVYLSAVACAKQMIKYKTPGAMCLIGSMSGLIANKGFTSSVYNSSKAAVIQLGRSLAMEWGVIKDFEDVDDDSVAANLPDVLVRKRGIRVNVLCPGNIMTPMVKKNFEDDPELRGIWEKNNMMGRISEREEYRGAALFMLSDASSFMTGSHLIVDGGYTAW